MKDLDKLIKAYQKVAKSDFNFKKKYGIELFGDGTVLYTRTKDDFYKLAELLKADVKVDGDPNIIAFYTIEYSNSTKIVFIEQQPMPKEQINAYLEALGNRIKEFQDKQK